MTPLLGSSCVYDDHPGWRYDDFRNIHTHTLTYTYGDKVIALSAPPYYVVGVDTKLLLKEVNKLLLTSCRREAATICPRPCDIDLWPSDLESGVRVTCDVGYLCADFSLPRPLCPQPRPDVRNRRQTDRQTDVRQHHRLMPRLGGGGIKSNLHNTGSAYQCFVFIRGMHCTKKYQVDYTSNSVFVWFLCCQENLEKNYHLLLSEHLSLQHNVANLLTSWTQTSPVLNSKPEKHTCGQVLCYFRTLDSVIDDWWIFVFFFFLLVFNVPLTILGWPFRIWSECLCRFVWAWLSNMQTRIFYICRYK